MNGPRVNNPPHSKNYIAKCMHPNLEPLVVATHIFNWPVCDQVVLYDFILQSLNLSSENEVADVYIHMLLNFCDNFAQEKHLTSKSSVEVDQSFSVTVGKVAESHQVISNMGIIYNILKKRFVFLFGY